jgi:hypothetical protein
MRAALPRTASLLAPRAAAGRARVVAMAAWQPPSQPGLEVATLALG